MGFDVCVWDQCNNRCLMCTNPDRPWPAWDGGLGYDYESLAGRLEASRDKILAADSIYLTGGEPTLHPDFLRLVKYIKDNFPKQRLKLLTNGRRFFYEGFARQFLETAGEIEVDLSIYGPNSDIHNSVTRAAGSFNQTIKGLDNLLKNKKKGQIIGARTVINQLSYRYLAQTLELVKDRFVALDRLIVIFPELEAQAVKNVDSIKVTYKEVAPYVKETQRLLGNFKEIRFYHFPLCSLEKAFWPHAWKTLPAKEVRFLKTCDKCQYKNLCVGIHIGYLENVGTEDFLPIKEKMEVILSEDSYRPINKVN